MMELSCRDYSRISTAPIHVERCEEGVTTPVGMQPPGDLEHVVATPLKALGLEEVLRMRTYARIGLVIASAGFVFVSVMGGGGLAKLVVLATFPFCAGGLCYIAFRTRDPSTFHHGTGPAIALVCASLPVTAAIPYCGPFSPVPVFVVLGIYAKALGASRNLARAIYVSAAFVQGLTAVTVVAGFADPGFIHPIGLSRPQQLAMQAMIQLAFAAAYTYARKGRHSQLAAIGALEKAVRAIAQRDAVIQEARDELTRGCGSRRGRFTEQTLGQYTLGQLLGRGGMGEVYDARNKRTNARVAVKVLTTESLRNNHHVQRFLREMSATASICSPHVVRVYEACREPLPHLVMERLEGQDLGSLLRERLMTHAEVADLVRQVGSGIAAAWKVGVTHRDLKPQNILRCGSTWKIIDFGVSRISNTGDTLTGDKVIGTPAYMAPEQAGGANIDRRVDTYSLSAIAYRALTGYPPFRSGEAADVIYRVVRTLPRRPSSLAPLWEDVDLVLAIGLAKEADNRFQCPEDLAEALAAALDRRLPLAIRRRAHELVTTRPVWAFDDELVVTSSFRIHAPK